MKKRMAEIPCSQRVISALDGTMKESTLQDIAKKKQLVMFERKMVDPNRKYGLLLDISSELVLLHYEYDFELDGYKIIRRRDITRLTRRDIERFHDKLLEYEGVRQHAGMRYSVDLTDWHSVLSSLQKSGLYVSLEHEPDQTYIYLVGKILRVHPKSVTMLGFDPLCDWHDAPTKISYTDITCISFSNRYIAMLSKYTK